ncbi:DUF3348 domain-containing protein [Luteimonas sp. Y-2-2-4F]|nr:DUF3348 family protein [Luteimonas sp. Y-2-2-4F]MCD9031222.1 DUF3348 domain-containing protein [Luteimonas sp. Y-2-2-4F]
MAQTPRRTTLRGPTFVHQLARLTGAEPAPPRQAPTERLGQWLDWTHAIALSAALDAPPAGASAAAEPVDGDADDDCARVRAALEAAIAGDPAFSSTEAGADAALDSAFFRQRYVALQRTMEAHIGRLRGRLRDRLAATDGLARLAAVDAAMERALARREQALLSAVPALLDARFARAHRSADGDAAESMPTPAPARAATPAAQLEAFRRDMRGLLLAELDTRLQPVEGLLAALRPREPGRHAQTPA